MAKLIEAIAAAAIASLCASCATITRGTSEQIQIVSDPPGAEARTSMGFVCVTPCTLQVGRKDEFTVTVSKPGYQPAEVPVTTKVNAGGGAAFAGNVVVGDWSAWPPMPQRAPDWTTTRIRLRSTLFR